MDRQHDVVEAFGVHVGSGQGQSLDFQTDIADLVQGLRAHLGHMRSHHHGGERADIFTARVAFAHQFATA